MSSRLILGLVLSVSTSSCASIGEKRETATADIAGLMRERTGFEPSALMPHDGSIAEPARQLLAQPLTEEAAIRIALLNNRQVAAAFARLGVGVAELHQAGLLANPVLAANAKFFGGGTEIELGITEDALCPRGVFRRAGLGAERREPNRLMVRVPSRHAVATNGGVSHFLRQPGRGVITGLGASCMGVEPHFTSSPTQRPTP